MTYFSPQEMYADEREAFLEWIVAEGLNPAAIYDNGKFSVHNGRISGEVFLMNPTSNELMYLNDEPVTVHFHVPQKNPLPEVLQ